MQLGQRVKHVAARSVKAGCQQVRQAELGDRFPLRRRAAGLEAIHMAASQPSSMRRPRFAPGPRENDER